MPSSIDSNYADYLLPKRLIFFDLDGTLIPSTFASGRRIAISMSIYQQVKEFAQAIFRIDNLPELHEEECSNWYRSNGGPQGLIAEILSTCELSEEIADCLSFYFNGLFNRRLTQYLKEDLKHDRVPDEIIQFLEKLSEVASMILVSYRYQTQFEFLSSLEDLGLTNNSLFGPSNAFAVGEPGTSSDGSKSRFVGKMWRREIRAQRRLTSEIGKTFPPLIVGDSIRDIHFAVDVGGIFFGVSETGEASNDAMVKEIKHQESNLSSRSRVFKSLLDEKLQIRILEECAAYQETIKAL
ncbi:MAG: hypothetical protein GKR93_04555 [Gammaproteobacteria bacterium]|nr:hypothetical protein [Gammaproteobacteria bacterium]